MRDGGSIILISSSPAQSRGASPMIFDRRVMRTTPGRFRTRIVTEGVVRRCTSTTSTARSSSTTRRVAHINDTRDFEIGRRLENLSALRKVSG
jgi:hypothetical protein